MALATGSTPETHLSMKHRTTGATDKRKEATVKKKGKTRKDEAERALGNCRVLLKMSY